MYPKDYQKDFKVEYEDNHENPTYVILRSRSIAKKCECCGSRDIASKGFRPRDSLMDVTKAGKPVLLSIKLQRYVCNACDARLKAAGAKSGELFENGKPVQSSYTSGTFPDCAKPRKKVSSNVIDEVINLIATEHLSSNRAAIKVGISPATASKEISKRRKKAMESVVGFMEPDILMVYPFRYSGKKCCALVGILGKRPMLFDILTCDKEETIIEVLKSKDTTDGRKWAPYVTLTDFPRPQLHAFLTERYSQHTSGILRECVVNEITKRYNRKDYYNYEAVLSIGEVLKELQTAFELRVYDGESFVPISTISDPTILQENGVDVESQAHENFRKEFNNWYDGLPKALKRALCGFANKVTNNSEKIVFGILNTTPENEPSKLLRFIDVCQHNKIPLKDLPSWLMLISGVHNKENITGPQMLSSSFTPQPIHNFYIDLNEVNRIFDQYSD